MHVAVRAIVPDHGIPPANLDVVLHIHKRQPIVAEEADGPSVVGFVGGGEGLADDVDGEGVEGFVGLGVLVGLRDGVHVGPEVVREVVVDGLGEVKVLQLGEGLQGRCGDDVDAKELGETVVVEVERVLGREEAILIRIKGPRVFHHVYIFWWPAGRDVANDRLLQQRPVAREPNIQSR